MIEPFAAMQAAVLQISASDEVDEIELEWCEPVPEASFDRRLVITVRRYVMPAVTADESEADT